MVMAHAAWGPLSTPTCAHPPTALPALFPCQVRGLGETIVSGTVPGAALTFVARKDDIENPKVGGWRVLKKW